MPAGHFLARPIALLSISHPNVHCSLQGVSLYCQQLWALLVKRAISAKRDRLAVWTQLCVPILLVLVALLAGRATSSFPQEPALRIDR